MQEKWFMFYICAAEVSTKVVYVLIESEVHLKAQ